MLETATKSRECRPEQDAKPMLAEIDETDVRRRRGGNLMVVLLVLSCRGGGDRGQCGCGGDGDGVVISGC